MGSDDTFLLSATPSARSLGRRRGSVALAAVPMAQPARKRSALYTTTTAISAA